MSLPPLNPEKSASGIILDPKTLERVVPTSKRSDGTVRRELKIRPGFTPQEDIGRFRSTRQSAADARKGFVPGSNRAPVKQVDPDNVFAQEKKEKTKAQLKNEKRREKKRAEAADKDWDEEEEEEETQPEPAETASTTLDGQAVGGAGFTGDIGKDGPIPSEQSFPPFGSHGTPPPIPSQEEPQGSTIPASQPAEKVEQNGVDLVDPPPSALDAPSSGTDVSSSASRPAKPPGTAAARHPIQGGRDGPIGLAHPPPIEQRKSDKAASWRKEPGKAPGGAGAGKGKAGSGVGSGGKPKPNDSTPTAAPPTPPEPRVRKEVKVRQGHNDVGSLANRLRSMVLENQKPGSPRAKKEGTPTPGP